MPFLPPNQQRQSTEGIHSVILIETKIYFYHQTLKLKKTNPVIVAK